MKIQSIILFFNIEHRVLLHCSTTSNQTLSYSLKHTSSSLVSYNTFNMRFSALLHLFAIEVSLVFQLYLHATTFAFQITPSTFKANVVPKKGKQLLCVKSKFDIPDDMRFSSDVSKGAWNLPILSDSIPTISTTITPREVIPRKACDIDENPTEYWFHNKIHTFGNTNILGGKCYVVISYDAEQRKKRKILDNN